MPDGRSSTAATRRAFFSSIGRDWLPAGDPQPKFAQVRDAEPIDFVQEDAIANKREGGFVTLVTRGPPFEIVTVPNPARRQLHLVLIVADLCAGFETDAFRVALDGAVVMALNLFVELTHELVGSQLDLEAINHDVNSECAGVALAACFARIGLSLAHRGMCAARPEGSRVSALNG